MAEKTTEMKKKDAPSAGASSKKAPLSHRISEFFRKYIRVLKLARRPTKQEFWKISAVAAIGILLIGIIGFIIYLLFRYLLP